MNDREVADYLLAHPDFFVEHAELLASIKLGNPHGKAAVSLQERQMEMLREKNKHLERRLSELLRYGHENDSIATKFGRWTTRVIAERDPYALPRTIAENLRDVFDVPQAALRIWDVAPAYAEAEFARHTGEEVRLYANSLDTPYCGANAGFEAAQWLDSSEGAAQSVAIIALRSAPEAEGGGAQGAAFGLLVMGSPDARRFHEGMATDFLTQIGALASAALTRLLPH
ncbi:DUF484 family protein [Paraburkholderia acidisoli]|uniref:DUF484 family protein n=1 Tax=Paraburkholderia acidisoli TaxID=2571748 RepID=A0A7Z2GJ75_9BURK|nr:DUF484 family protein [Paraburkholderia acidisoli]QGZ62808.1 DUF484 family protein [Paraburkholderia acidisoli]